jgi:hypothetical protein
MKELNEMSSKELEDLKKKLYKENTDNGNIKKLYTIARMLGEHVNANYGPKYLYKKGETEIYVDDYGGYMTVQVGDNKKVSTHFCNNLYVPGEWEAIITEVYPSAKEKLEANKLQTEQRAKSDLLSQLGGYFNPNQD